MRISRHNMWMEMARIVARRGTCPRLCVGAVAVLNKRQFSVGYNGAEAGAPHCTEVGCLTYGGSESCVRTIHAEVNALEQLPLAQDARQKSLYVYVTHSPCMKCAEVIIGYGVNVVFFETMYGKTAPIIHLLDNDVAVNRLLPNGYIVEGDSGVLVEAD